jgi:hypothetical protein
MRRRGRAWVRALSETELAIKVRAPFAEECRPTGYEEAQGERSWVADETSTQDTSSEGNPDTAEFDSD